MDFIGKALAPDGTAAEETEGTEETELGGDFWDDFLSASPRPPSPTVPTPLLGSAPAQTQPRVGVHALTQCVDRIYLYQKIS